MASAALLLCGWVLVVENGHKNRDEQDFSPMTLASLRLDTAQRVRREPLTGGAGAVGQQPEEYRDVSLEEERQEEVVDHEAALEGDGVEGSTARASTPTIIELPPRRPAGQLIAAHALVKPLKSFK